MSVRTIVLSFLLLLSAAPLAAATNVCQASGPAYVCAGDFNTGCSSSTGANAFVGSLSPLATANVNGATHRCSNAEAVTASAWVSGQSVAVRWWDGATCYHEVRAAGNGQQVACPAGGPPDLAWGSLLTPPMGSAEADCVETAAGVACVGRYAWTEGDGCVEAGKSEDGSGVWTETVAGDASATGSDYCNIYGGYGYWEQALRLRANTTIVFLEISWNTWSFEEFDGPNDLGGCSFWIYYIGPVYGYYNNVGCPAGQEPPVETWRDLFE